MEDKSVINIIGIKDPRFKRLAIANYMDNINGTCSICKHKFQSVDDFIERDPVYLGRDDKRFVVCCKTCKDDGDGMD